jgi:hypothetical protein
MIAILRTYLNETIISEELVEVDDDHIFAYGPYQSTVPFSVGSNQAIIPFKD